MKQKGTNLIRRSLHVRHVNSGGCNGCDFELMMLHTPDYDAAQYGIEFVASPRHADALLVTGGVTRNLEEALLRTHEATPNPKWVVLVGDCAIGTCPLKATYAHHGGVEKVLPADLKIPGCPPSPEKILQALRALMKGGGAHDGDGTSTV